MATTPAEHLREVAAVTARDRHLITQWRGQGEAMNETGDKIAALTDVACALEGAGVRYALIGGVAVGIHSGAPRATADVDLAVHSQAARSAVRATLEGVGFHFVG
jgi:hypothetical protein